MKRSRCLLVMVLAGFLASHISNAQSTSVPPGLGTANNPYRIYQLSHLVWMSQTVNNSAGKHYKLQNDIDAKATGGWNDPGTGAIVKEGFSPIGNGNIPFAGYFDGQKHVIRNLYINRGSRDHVGLFGCLNAEGIIQRLGVTGGAIIGREYVGGLVGKNLGGLISENYSSIVVSGRWDNVGGLIGYNLNSTIRECYTKGITRSAIGWKIGGLVGYNAGSSVLDCYSTGNVMGGEKVGGLIGLNEGADVARCYARGNLVGAAEVGGLVGRHEGYAGKSTIGKSIRDSYASGRVSGSDYVGGFAGIASLGGFENCYSIGFVQAEPGARAGGFLAENLESDVSNCYWDEQTSGQVEYITGRGTGLRTAQMLRKESYSNWDYTSIWNSTLAVNSGYPFLRNKAMVQFAVKNIATTEGNIVIKIRVRRFGDLSGSVSLKYATQNKTALAGQDYIRKTGTLTWSGGDSSARVIKVTLLDDSSTEPKETFLIKAITVNGADCVNSCTIMISANAL